MKRNESGRTMIEMIAVLAIMGVLSIGGVAGYGRAVNEYRASTILDAAQKGAVQTSSHLNMGSTTSDNTKPEAADVIKTPTNYIVHPTDTTGSVDNSIDPNGGYFGMVVGDDVNGTTGSTVTKKIARRMFERVEESLRYVHGFGIKRKGAAGFTWVSNIDEFDAAVGDDDEVVVIFIYATDLSLRTGGLFTDLEDLPDIGDEKEPEEAKCTEVCADCYSCQEGTCKVDPTQNNKGCMDNNGNSGTCNNGQCKPIANNCPKGTSENGAGGDATEGCKCNEWDEKYQNGKCVTCKKYNTYESTHLANVAPQELCCAKDETAYCTGSISGSCANWACCAGPYIEGLGNWASSICCNKGQQIQCKTPSPWNANECLEYQCI